MTNRRHGKLNRCALGVAALCFACPVVAQTVERRGGLPPVHGSIVSIDDAGVTIEKDLGNMELVPWDRVRSVMSPAHAFKVEQYWSRAEDLWRARTRLERNDTALAEPLFERLFDHYRNVPDSETSLVVAEGLLRCRLARGRQSLALVPYLETLRLRRKGIESIVYKSLPAVLDDTSMLCTTLAPWWLDSPILARVREDVLRFDARGDAVVAELAQMYAQSLGVQRGTAADESDEQKPTGEPGAVLLRQLMQCRSADAREREEARELLLRTASSRPEFARAWSRFAVGESLLRESGIVRQQRGMMHLLHLPAQFGQTQPYLTGVSLALVAAALDDAGDHSTALALQTELASLYPNHPVGRQRPSLVERIATGN